MRTTMVAAALVLALVCAQAAHAVEIPVTTTADELNADGDCSLREAVRAANTDAAVDACEAGDGADSIVLAAGTYTLSVAGTLENQALTGDLDLTEGVSIVGVGADSTIVDANDIDRVFDVQTSDPVELEALTIRNGSPAVTDFGGAVNVDIGGDLRVIDARVESSHTEASGGGIYARSATLTMTGSVVSGNSANDHGGGVYLHQSNAAIMECTIDGNDAAMGGGIATSGDTASFVVHVSGTTISNNGAGVGGGGVMTANFCDLTLENCTVSGNTSPSAGGVMTSFTEALRLVNTTITNNTADGSAGGLVHGSGTGFTTMNNTIVAGNIGNSGANTDCFGTLTSEGYNLIGDVGPGCTVGGTTTGNVTGVSVNLGALANNGGPTFTHLPLVGSPAINAGDPATPDTGGTSCLPFDQRGAARPGSTRCDIGAVEGDSTPPTTTTTSTTSTSTTTTTSTSTTTTTTTSSTTTSSSSSTTSTTSTSTASTSSAPATTSTMVVPTTAPPPPTVTSTTLPPLCLDGVVMSDTSLKLAKIDDTPGDEKLTFKATMAFPADVPAELDPATHGMQIVISQQGMPPVPLLVLPAQAGGVPPGARGSGCGPKDGWKKTTYVNTSGAVSPPDCPPGSARGLRSIKLKDLRAKGKGIKILVKAVGATFPAPSGGIHVTIVLGNMPQAGIGGLCAVHYFGPSSCTAFKSKVSCL